jgi:hypothetical protein
MRKITILVAALGTVTVPATAQAPMSPAARLAAQREAMRAFDFLDGTWRGPASSESGKFHTTQTERVGSLLDGTVKVIEGRSYDSSGRTMFNALGIISYDPVRRSYSMHSYAMSYSGDFPVEVRKDGFSWTQPAGPSASVRYTATISNGEWHETGDRIAGTGAPVRIFEMRLKRLGSTDWPAADPVPPK